MTVAERDKQVLDLFEQAGFSRTSDAVAFEYVAHWLKNNQFRPGTPEELIVSVLQSVGVVMYKEKGQIPDISD